jgi:TRAP-type transport system small permease protein
MRTLWLGHVVATAGVVALLVMVVATLLAVVARYFGVTGFEWSYEVAGIAFVWVTFLGAIVAEARQENAAFEIIRDTAKPSLKRALMILSHLVLAIVGGVLLVSSIAMVQRSALVPTPLLRWPSFVMSGAAPVLGGSLCLLAVMRLTRMTRRSA